MALTIVDMRTVPNTGTSQIDGEIAACRAKGPRSRQLVFGCNTVRLWPTSGSTPTYSTSRTRSRSTLRPAHLFKHPHLGVEDIDDVWTSDPLFYPAKAPADVR
jgi:hypothetical protein